MSRYERHDTPMPKPDANRPLQKLLCGLALVFFGASMMLPFQDDKAGLYAVFTVLGQPTQILYWLFPLCTLAFARLIFRLHDIRVPIFKALLLGCIMLVAVVHLYFNRNGINVGIGVPLWLSSGYILTAAAVRWRYPTRGILFGFTALILSVWLSIWVQSIFQNGNGGQVWKSSQQADDSMLPAVQTPAETAPPPPAEPVAASAADTPAEQLGALNPRSLIAVEREHNLYNPWQDGKAATSCENAIKRHYPVLLPPRFTEDGYEWRNYHFSDAPCNTLLYVGTPGLSKQPDYHYKITQDRRSNIYLILSNTKGKPLFQEAFPMTRDSNGLLKSGYTQTLNRAFAQMTGSNGGPEQQIDNEYVFARAEAPAKSESLSRGCDWQPVAGRANTFQWGTGRINWRGQSLLRPQTFCSANMVGVVHLSPQGSKNDARLAVKLFRSKDLKPIECGALAITVQPSDVQGWLNGQLQADNLLVEPATGSGSCLNVTVKLNDSRRLSSAVN